MSIWQAAILGLLQGLTEFLPVSSSGHLVLMRAYWETIPRDLLFEVTVHLATLLAVVAYYRHDIMAIFKGAITGTPSTWAGMSTRRWVGLIMLGSIPAAVVGLLLRAQLEATFSDGVGAGMRLMATGALLFSTAPIAATRRSMSAAAAFLIGIAQAVAILPGISRSGATIATGIWGGVEREQAARYSFLLSLPVIASAFLFQLSRVLQEGVTFDVGRLAGLLVGFVVALVSGYFAVAILIRVLIKTKFAFFGIWCWIVGIWALKYFGR